MKTLLFFGPIAKFPFNNGGSIRTQRLYEELSHYFEEATLIGMNFTTVKKQGGFVREDFKSTEKSKKGAAVLSLLTKGHYLKLKHVSSSLIDRFKISIRNMKPDVVIMSYLYCTEFIEFIPKGSKVFIDTHNDDWEWFSSLSKSSKNTLVKFVCKNSILKTEEYLRKLPDTTGLIHVSESDLRVYQDARNSIKHYLAPNGCDIHRREHSTHVRAGATNLIFVGSLSSKMNVDALSNFANKYWPHLSKSSIMSVVGSSPTSEVIRMSDRHKWKLVPNATAKELDEEYTYADFLVMPFEYGAGSKLKFFEACGRGVPIIATTAGATGLSSLPDGAFVSNSPESWLTHIETFCRDEEVIDGLYKFAEEASWSRIARNLMADILSDTLTS
jgi:hypothetical protein